ncbi:putative flavin-containing monooxygenase [Gordonia effusa NBRC 100432]|uniref:Putative flavin-containing monooxygenase n=1 Tax=Gordonia effusa NBRC 100432 TaxID=1077974 RepID=H0R0H9_9ACTN|nr:NAD(P)-binding domain-containing protein [Gordonia effusa]GAB18580.1 putative flavin-containing monooxygenase [Gordonia effusa NBRC 100432]
MTATATRADHDRAAGPVTPDTTVLIIGAGFGGICTGVELKRVGIDDFIIIDRHDGVGGTWKANTYPGVAVDVPAVYYSFSFEPYPKSTRVFPPGQEVMEYADHVVDKYDLRRHLQLSNTATRTEWDEANNLWRVELNNGERTITARFVVAALGFLEVPKMPDFPGLDKFKGKVVHSARWDHDYDYNGKKIAVVGTGASALQLVPEVAHMASHLTVFQRTPIWVGPKPDFPIDWGADYLLRIPFVRKTVRVIVSIVLDIALGGAIAYLKPLQRIAPKVRPLAVFGARLYYGAMVRDKKLVSQLSPDYMIGCKRPSLSNKYLPTFKRDDVALVTDSVTEVTEKAIVTADGKHHEIDVLVCATGFHVGDHKFTPEFPVLGEGGEHLGDFWNEKRFQAYQGVSVPGWPNVFLIDGPYGYSPNSQIAAIECTAGHARRAIEEAVHRGATRVEVKQEPHDEYFQQCFSRLNDTDWAQKLCSGTNTYYINYQGDILLRPSMMAEAWLRNKYFPHEHYSYTAPATGGAELPSRRGMISRAIDAIKTYPARKVFRSDLK